MTRLTRALALCAVLQAASPALATDAATLQALSGTWVSPAAEPWYGGYGTREFVLSGGQWQLIFTHALDPAMTQRTFQFRTGGGYRIGAETALPGAFEADFAEDWKHVTLLMTDPGLIAAFGMADCGLTPNLETDISASGCGGWQPVAVCCMDHDILALSDAGLQFGVRPADNDMCTPDKRPTALLPAVVKR